MGPLAVGTGDAVITEIDVPFDQYRVEQALDEATDSYHGKDVRTAALTDLSLGRASEQKIAGLLVPH